MPIEPLTEEQYEPIRSALFDHRNGSAAEAKQRLAESLASAGYRLVNPKAMAEDCQDPWECCIHTPGRLERGGVGRD